MTVHMASQVSAQEGMIRYRPAARAEAVDTSTGHVGFRRVVRQAREKCSAISI